METIKQESITFGKGQHLSKHIIPTVTCILHKGVSYIVNVYMYFNGIMVQLGGGVKRPQ